MADAVWTTYIKNVRAYSKNSCDKAAIIGLDGNVLTSTTALNSLNISPTEAATIATAFSNKAYDAEFRSNGVTVDGVTYKYLKHDEDEQQVMAKKKECGAITMQASKTAVVIGHTFEGAKQEFTNIGVDSAADFLKKQDR